VERSRERVGDGAFQYKNFVAARSAAAAVALYRQLKRAQVALRFKHLDIGSNASCPHDEVIIPTGPTTPCHSPRDRAQVNTWTRREAGASRGMCGHVRRLGAGALKVPSSHRRDLRAGEHHLLLWLADKV